MSYIMQRAINADTRENLKKFYENRGKQFLYSLLAIAIPAIKLEKLESFREMNPTSLMELVEKLRTDYSKELEGDYPTFNIIDFYELNVVPFANKTGIKVPYKEVEKIVEDLRKKGVLTAED